MSATSLIQFDAGSSVVSSINPKSKVETVRLMTAKEFKDAKGLKGNEAKIAYNAYIREHGGANTGGLMAACATGEMLVIGRKYSPSTGKLNVTFIEKSKVKDPTVKAAPAPELTQAVAQRDTLMQALAKLGTTTDEINALLAMATPAAPAVPAPVAVPAAA